MGRRWNPPAVMFYAGLTLIAFNYFGFVGAGITLIVAAIVSVITEAIQNG